MEYRIKYGILGYYFYFFMFFFIKKKLKILSVSHKFNHVKVKNILHPSELTNSWFKKKELIKNLKQIFYILGGLKKKKVFIT